MKSSVTKKVLAVFIAVVIIFGFANSAIDFVEIIIACIKDSYFPFGYVATSVFVLLSHIAFLLVPRKLYFPEKMQGFTNSTIALTLVVMVVGTSLLDYYNEQELDSFPNVDYPSYLNEFPTQTLSEDREYNYSGNKLYFEGFVNFQNSGFRNESRIQVVKNSRFQDSFRVEVKYKGYDAEMYVNTSIDDNGEQKRYIDMWLSDYTYDYDPTPQDYVYMFKYREDSRYSERFAVEKLTIYTAYPELIDTSGLE